MKASSKTIIYDDGCPLCTVYTTAFVAAGMLNSEGRKSFSNIDAATFALVDKTKCNNEIPLVDNETKQVWYGIDALLQLLDQKIPFAKVMGNIKPVNWVLRKCYNFISYNRKVIVATKSKSGYDCSPDFNVRYRIAFLIVFLLANSLMLSPYFYTVFSKSFMGGRPFIQLQAAHFILVAVNVVLAVNMGRRKGLEYLGQVNMLALISLLLLGPLHLLNSYLIAPSESTNNIYLGLASIVVVIEYIRRMEYLRLLQQHWIITINLISVTLFFMYLNT